MLFVATARSLLIFRDVTFKMAAWRPYWIFRFPDSNFSLALNIKSKLHWHITCVYGKKPIDFQHCHFQNGHLAVILDYSNFSLALNIKSKLHWHITCVYGKKPIDFQHCHFQNGHLAAILDFSVSGLCSWHGLQSVT